jgi:ketosteroid isomerase-like protein
MKADAMTEAAMRAVMDKVAEGYSKRDLSMMQATFALDPDVVMYGTGVNENRIGVTGMQAKAEHDWSLFDKVAITYGWTSISAAGRVAWAASDAAFKVQADGQEMTLPVRITFVFEKRGDDWRIVQAHFSSPTPD